MRRLVLLLMCFSLSFPAWAGLVAAASCCPSQTEMAQEIVDAAATGEALPDCCNDLATYLQTGQACKTTSAAHLPLLGWPQGSAVPLVPPACDDAPAGRFACPPSAEPEGIWRPPL